jgi:WD40 repeat protein
MPFNFLKTLDADDIFISYAREDGAPYLTGLDAALSKSGFSCFTDKRGTDADRLPPKTLFKKIRACKTLVLLATPCALKAPENITPEVSEFAEANGTSRIISVSFDRDAEFANWSKTPWFDYVVGKAREREDLNALKTGAPSPSVVASIVAASDYMKSKDRLRKYRNRALAGFLSLMIAGFAAAGFAVYGFWQARNAKAAADLAQRDAIEKIGKAREDVRKATEQAQQDIKKARDEAQTKISEANELTRVAEGQRLAAEQKKKEAEGLRDQARAEAQKQSVIGESRRLANSSQAMLRQRPEAVPQSLERAKEAMNKASSIKLHILEADTAMRDSLALLPRLRPNEVHITQATLVLSPDGRHFAKLDNDRLRVYPIDSRQPVKDVSCACSAVALSSGATHAAALLKESTNVRIIDLNNDALSHNIDLGKSARMIALSPAGRYVALSFGNGEDVGTFHSLQVRETSTGKIVKSFDDEDSDAAQSTSDSERPASGSEQSTSPPEQPTKANVVASCGRIDMTINGLAFGADGSLVIGGKYISPQVGRFTGRVIIWSHTPDPTVEYTDPDLTAGFPEPEIIPQSEEVKAVAVGGGGRYFATDLGVWKKTSRQARFELVARLPYTLEGEFQFDPDSPATEDQVLDVRSLAFSVDGSSLVLARRLPTSNDAVTPNEREALEVWDATGNLDLTHVFHDEKIATVGFKPDGETVATTAENNHPGLIRAFQTSDGAEVKPETPFGPEDGLVLYASPGEGLIVTATDDAAMVWDVWKREKTEVQFGKHLRSVDAATLSPGGRFLALSGLPTSSAVVVVYRLEERSDREGRSYQEWKKLAQNGIVKNMFLSADGRTLATRNDDDTARIFDVGKETDVTPTSLLSFRGARVVALSVDGRLLAVAGRDDVTSLVDVAKGSTAAMSLLLDQTAIESLAFSPGRRYVGLGSTEGMLHVFDLNSTIDTREIARLAHIGSVTAIAFSNDDKYVATASSDPHPYHLEEEESYPLRVWLLRPADLVAEAEARIKGLPQYPR